MSFTTRTEITEFRVVPERVIIIQYRDVVNIIERQGGKLNSIKEVRVHWDIGLRDAKEIVEQTADQMGFAFADAQTLITGESPGKSIWADGVCPICEQLKATVDGRLKCVYFYCQGSRERFTNMGGGNRG